jgi:hypothetical protein
MQVFSIDALRKCPRHIREILPRAAQTGLEYFDDMQVRIPRDTVARIGGEVITVAETLAPGCKGYLCGS